MATVRGLGSASDEHAPSAETLVEQARAMIPVLKERSARTVVDRKIPEETIAEMQEAGFFRVLQPRRWGGYEMHPNVFFDIQKLLAEGCMSTGWVYGVIGGHPYHIALFADKAQREVWEGDTSALASSSYQPVGKVEPVEGGFRLSGRWGFSSGCDHCQWVLLGALVPPEEQGGPPDMRTFLLPRDDYRIEDAWHVFGLQGTGSQDIVVEDVFVPDYRTHRAADGFLGTNPGQKKNDAPLYRLPWAQLFVRLVSTAALGGARAAARGALKIAEARVSTNTGKASKSDPVLATGIARLWSELDEMEIVLRRNFDQMVETVTAGGKLEMEDRARFRFQSGSVVRRCAALVDALMPLLGGRAIYMSSPVVQPWLDLNAARAHVANSPENFGPDVPAVLLGEAPSFSFL